MEKEFLTVKEFAETMGVSVQSVYKKINKPNHPINRFLTVVNGVKLIEKGAVALFNSPSPAPTAAKEQAKEAAKERQTTEERVFSLLEKQLEEQRRQLQEKDRQLEEKDKQIDALLGQLKETSKMVIQQQQLAAADKMLTAPTTSETEDGAEPLQQEEEKTKEEPTQKKKGVLKKLFKRG